ncbi:MAG: HIT domain-containing protein [Nanoarchaeota archaeon]
MDYEQFKIKCYDKWDLYLHANQYPYIGRCYAWAKRDSALNAMDMDREEMDDLFGTVIPEWDSAIKQLFRHDTTNLACLCNEARHLHWHLIPRYNSPMRFYEIEFADPNPDGNYSPYPKQKIQEEILLRIKDDITSKLTKTKTL